jgi:acyltransferase
MEKDRLHWIDIAKGIGILLVIYGHALNGNSFRYIIYSFHMPLFFLLSGIVFRHIDHEKLSAFLKKDYQKILLPYFIFASLSMVYWLLTMDPKDRTPYEVGKQIFGIFYGNGNAGFLTYNVALWFLPCLFITKLGFWLLTTVSEKKKFLLISLFIFSVLGFLVSIYFKKVYLPFGLESALTAIVFFGAGYFLHEESERVKAFFHRYNTAIFLAGGVIMVIVATVSFQAYGFQVDMRTNKMYNYLYFYIAAAAGILGTFALSRRIGKSRLLEYLGRSSMMLFVWHTLIFTTLTDILLLFVSKSFIKTYQNTLLAPLYTVIAIVTIFFFAYVFKRIHQTFLSKSYDEL